MKTIPQRALSVLLLLFPLLVGLVAAPASASPSAAGPVLMTANGAPESSVLTNIRVGRHRTFDRVVLDIRGPKPETVHTMWVKQLTKDGSGFPVSLPGQRFLQVTTWMVNAHDPETGMPTYTGARKFRTFATRNLRAVALIGDFEATVTVGLGFRHKSWVRTFMLSNPTRVVIDVGR